MQKSLTTSLNEVNSQLTDVQRIVVATLTAIQSGRINENEPHVANLRALYQEGWTQMQGFLTSLRSATMALTQAQPAAGAAAVSQIAGGPTRVTAKELLATPSVAVRQQTEPSPSRQALHDLAAELAHGAPGMRRKPTEAAAPATGGPTLKGGARAPAATQADQDVVAALQSIVAPVAHNPESADTMARRQVEEVANGLVRLAIGNQGVLETWFSNVVFPAGKGVKKAIPDVNLYAEDIGAMPYSRLKGWPEGFYTNAKTSAYQYLAHTENLTVVIDFGLVNSDDVASRQNGMQVISKGDIAERKYPITHLENEFLKAVLLELSDHFKNVWATQQL